jgi:hypothetical protein
MDALRELGDLLCAWFLDVSAEPGFLSGVLIGAFGLAVVAFVVFRVRVWWGSVTAPFAPLRVTHTTSETPASVVLSSCTTLVVGLLVFACIIGIVAEILRPGTWQEVVGALGR